MTGIVPLFRYTPSRLRQEQLYFFVLFHVLDFQGIKGILSLH